MKPGLLLVCVGLKGVVRGTAPLDLTLLIDDEILARPQEAGARPDFHQALGVDNSAQPVARSLKVQAVKLAAEPPEVTTERRPVFVPQTPESYAHDADGNLETDGRWQYTWDAENRLVAMETRATAVMAGVVRQRLEFVYDDWGRRVAKRVQAWDTVAEAWTLSSSRAFLWDGWTLLAELEASGGGTLTPAVGYTWGHEFAPGAGDGARHLVCVQNFTGSGAGDYAPIQGSNFNLAGYVDLTTGTQVAAYDYGPFGESVSTSGPLAREFRFRFSTKCADDETGLLYYGLRYYSPNIGRWLSRDPLQERGGVNLYGYVGNDPVDWFDPLGLSKCSDLALEILSQAGKLAAEWAKYDPVADAKGGFRIPGKFRQVGSRSYPQFTKPGGHYKEMMDLKRGLWNRLNDFKRDCWDDDDCPKPPKIPVWVWDIAKKQIPVSVAPLSSFEEWARSVPAESIPTPFEAFLFGSGGALLYFTGVGELGTLGAAGGLSAAAAGAH